jgi:tetratricopeptide (TPR) repeat protein
MSSDKDESKDQAFSFEKTPDKIGGETEAGKTGQADDFNFSDIPVLGGKTDKDKKVSFSFDSKKNIKAPVKEQGIASYEAILRDQLHKPQEKDKGHPDVPETETQQQKTDEPQSKWDKIASAKGPALKQMKSVKLLIIFAIAAVIVLASGVSAFFLLKSEPQPEKGAQATRPAGAVKTAKPDPKAEENARRLAEFEKKLTAADAARKESKFSDALKPYQDLVNEGWKEKEPLLLFNAAECLENMSQADEAVTYYIKCIDAGWKDNAQAHVRIAKLLNRKTKYSDSIQYLEKARVAFPSDTSIGAQLAESYFLAGQTDKAAEELKKSNKSDLSIDMIKLYGSVLLKNNDKEQAREVYTYGMKKFRDLDCFVAAAGLSDKPQDKIDIMTQAVGIVDENRKTQATMRLTELLVQNARKDEAAKQLEKINIDQLKPESVTDFLKMLVTCGSIAKFTPEYKKATELYPKDFAMHRTMYETLMENGLETLAIDSYREWWEPKKEDAVGGYLYAKGLGLFTYRSIDTPNEDCIPIYKKASELNPQFFEAFLELGYLYTMERNWAAAEQAYSECVKIKPADRNARSLLALTGARTGKGEAALDEYEKYLDTLNLQPEEKAAELIETAQRLEKPGRAEKYLEILGKSPRHASEYSVQMMKFKLVFGKPGDNDFADSYPKAGRKFHVYYLLSKGKSNEILLMTVPPDEFPDFWKLFILWKNDKTGWQEGMDALLLKNKWSKDATYRIIADIWNGKKSPDEARKLLNKIHPDNEPLFFLMLAEKYRKDKVVSKAKVCYQKAASERQNPLVSVIDYYSQIPIK